MFDLIQFYIEARQSRNLSDKLGEIPSFKEEWRAKPGFGVVFKKFHPLHQAHGKQL